MTILFTLMQLLCALALILSVLFQNGSKHGLGAIGGSNDTFMGKNKSDDMDSKLKKVTAISGILFVLATVALNIVALTK